MISFVAAARATFSAVAKTLTFARPATAVTGDVLIAFVANNDADAMPDPAGWTLITIFGSGANQYRGLARMLEATDSPTIVFGLTTVANEWQAELVVLRRTSPGVVFEISATSTFTSATSLATPGVTVQQAINLLLVSWICSGSPTLTAPAGFTTIDSFTTSVVGARSMLIAFRLTGATGALSLPSATASAATTGRSCVVALRGGIPATPSELFDPVPGNIGLIAKDTRPAR